MSDEPRLLGALAQSLALAQSELRDPSRSKSGQVRGKRDYRYAGLDDLLAVVRPALSKHGIAFLQTVERIDGEVVLTTRLIHGEGGQIVSNYPMDWSGCGPQEKGARTTYARRYSLEAMVGVAPTDGDDDAAQAQQHHEQRRSSSPSSLPAAPTGARSAVSPAAEGARGGDPVRQALYARVAAVKDQLPAGTLATRKQQYGIENGVDVRILRDFVERIEQDAAEANIPEPGSDLEEG